MNFPDSEIILRPEINFPSSAKDLWDYQVYSNKVMHEFLSHLTKNNAQHPLKKHPTDSLSPNQYSFNPVYFPISFFREFEMRCGEDWQPEKIFLSSGTTGQQRSRHLIRDYSIYKRSHLRSFRFFYKEEKYRIFGLLPGYLENPSSSLVAMISDWIKEFGTHGSRIYGSDFSLLANDLMASSKEDETILLIGVTHALLDFTEKFPIQLSKGSIVMETGGMKGRKAEWVRDEVHEVLKNRFSIETIHSEYGMTEMLSQAYSYGGGRFFTPPWLQIQIGDIHSPFTLMKTGEPGRILISDLGNIHSCAFIRSDDLGRINEDGSFEVLGRMDNSELRGCSLMYL